jgi:ferredoxin
MAYVIGQPCVDECPAEAIYYEDDLTAALSRYLADNEAFFTEVLPGRDEPSGSPGGAAKVGPLGVDTPLVAARSRADETKGA